MFRFILWRIAFIVPVLLIVSVLAFFFSASAPGDIIEEYISLEQTVTPANSSYEQRMSDYERMAQKLGKDRPLFYFTIAPASYPDTLYRIIRRDERRAAVDLLLRYNNWQDIQRFRNIVLGLAKTNMRTFPDSLRGYAGRVAQDAAFLLITADKQRSEFLLNSMRQDAREVDMQFLAQVQQAETAWQNLYAGEVRKSTFIPAIQWHGTDNQYHHWLSRMFRGDFGISLIDGRKVSTKIGEAVRWTLRLNVTAILLAFLISIPLGVFTAKFHDKLFDRLTSALLFAFFAIPSFWLATLFVVFFTTPEYGSWTDLFPTSGVGSYSRAESAGEQWSILAEHLFLPVLCLLLGALAYLTRQMRGGMLREMKKDYVRMAYAKGLSERRIYWRHIFPNAAFPMLTILGAAIPATISGSVIIEVIFAIPGMGQLMYTSILRQDWPVVFTVIIIAAVLTVAGYLLSDILYRVFDPRIRHRHRVKV